jgi:hypothetical protein
MSYEGQTITELKEWIKEHPCQVDGVVERWHIIQEMEDNPYKHYYGYRRPLD